MSDKIDQLKFINKCIKYTVFGYVREAQSLFQCPITQNEKIIPQIIASICTIFYYENEYLTPAVDSIVSLDQSCKTIESLPTESQYLYEDNIAYGSIFINPYYHSDSLFQWQIKLLQVNDRIKLGIFTASRDSFYSLVTSGKLYKTGPSAENAVSIGKWGNYYSPQLKTNDIVTMELDIKNQTIRYFLNNINLGVAFKNIDIHTSYNLGMHLRRKDKLKLIHFQETMVSDELANHSYDPVKIESLIQLDINVAELVIRLLSQRTDSTIDDDTKMSIRQFVDRCNIDCKSILRRGRKAFLYLLRDNTNLKLGHGCKIFKYIEREILNQNGCN